MSASVGGAWMNLGIMDLALGMRTLDDIRDTSIHRRIDEFVWNVLMDYNRSVFRQMAVPYRCYNFSHME